MKLLHRMTAILAIIILLGAQSAAAQQIRIIRDAEIEGLIADMLTPLMRVAGVRQGNQRIYIVADRRFNAFVIENGSIFINYGTILDVETPNALRAVLAHEIGHLAGGHLARIREQADITARLQIVAMALGVGALAAGSAGGVSQVSGMAAALILASQSVGTNSLMAFRRTEESAADASAIKFLEDAGYSTRGMVDVLEMLNENQGTVVGASPYLRSHPLPADRVNRVEQAARQSRAWGRRDSNADISRLALAQAKITGFLESQSTTLDRYPNSNKSLAARYARIITAYKSGAAISAIQQVPNLINAAPQNPYFYELYGQLLLETGQPERALPPLRQALALASDQPQIRVLYGHTLVEAGGRTNLEEAIVQLSRVVTEEPGSVRAYTLLARAHAELGHQGKASLAAAEAAYARGDKGTALGLARQARDMLPEGSPAWLRADDILSLTK